MGVVVVWAGQPLSCERELACSCFASPQYTIPVLPSSPSALSTSGGPLLFVTWWPKWSGGTEDHFGCKWLPWGSPVRAPLATPVALPRAFMPISSPRIRVQLCTAAYSCSSPDSFQSLAAIVSEERIRQVQKRSSIKEKSHQVSYLALLLSESIVVLHRSQKFSLITMEAQPPPGYNATFDETHLGRHHGREKGSSPSTV